MRKGQIQQVFIYLMAILVIGFLVVIAFRLIPGIINQSCDVEDTQFLINLKDAIDAGSRSGRTSNPVIGTPCDYTILCLVNASAIGDHNFEINAPPLLEDRYQVIQSSVRDGIEYNVFLIQEGASGTTRPVFYDDRINTKGTSMVCVNASNKRFDFWTKGLGSEGILAYTED